MQHYESTGATGGGTGMTREGTTTHTAQTHGTIHGHGTLGLTKGSGVEESVKKNFTGENMEVGWYLAGAPGAVFRDGVAVFLR